MRPLSQESSPELPLTGWISFRDGKLEQYEPSPYGWMSIRDGELLKTVLLNAAAARKPHPIRVLEWGAGQSTLSFTAIFHDLGIPYRWLALEYDRAFCDAQIAQPL